MRVSRGGSREGEGRRHELVDAGWAKVNPDRTGCPSVPVTVRVGGWDIECELEEVLSTVLVVAEGCGGDMDGIAKETDPERDVEMAEWCADGEGVVEDRCAQRD